MMAAGRLRLLAVLLAVWGLVVWGRLAQLQLAEHATWEQQAEAQRERVREVKEARGEILTRDGRLLAGSLSSVAVCANPTRIPREEWPELAASLSPLIGAPEAQIRARFASEKGFFYLAKDLPAEVSSSLEPLSQKGLWTERSERRVYPLGPLAGSVVGFVDAEGVGQAGLERSYESTLAGIPSIYRELCDGKILSTPIDLRLEKAGRPGQSLVLSLDSRVQLVVEQELERALDTIGARGAAAVVMDPRTGEVLALGSLPGYDPGHVGQSRPECRRNRAVEFALEPGSVFKPIVVSAALAAGVVTPGELVDCSGGGIQVANVFMRDHGHFGLLSVRDVIAQSSNTGAIRIAHRLGADKLDGMIRALGFGRRTGIELPAETPGIYRGPQSWSALSRAGLALGEEIAVSPLQVAQAYAAIADGGVLLPPVLVRETLDSKGRPVTPRQRRQGVRVMPRAVAREVASMLEAVVDEGTGRAAQVAGYRVGGKTGTAQKGADGGGLRSGAHAAWFAGFLPVQDPSLVIVVCVDEPRRTYWASDVAAPVFGRIAARLVSLLGIAPDRVEAL